MDTPAKYNPLLSWKTIATSVYQITRELDEDPATYCITVNPIDNNDLKAGEVYSGCYFTDFWGIPFRIFNVVDDKIHVSDDFKTGCSPVADHIGIVHKSAYKGYSLYLPADIFRHLHPLSAQNNNKYAMSILWKNDPNARRISFINVLMPEITDYRADLVDEDGVTFNPMEDYGQNPQFDIFQILEDGTYSQIFLGMNITRNGIDGLIDSILFSGTGELITGYILIKN